MHDHVESLVMTRPEREMTRWLGNALTDFCRTTSLVGYFLKQIDGETHDHERSIVTRCAIECEGLEGTVKSPVGSINFASLFATGENYIILKVKG